jgi:hypothetical protein
MIVYSDDGAAVALWDEVGGASAVAGFNQLAGLTETVPGPGERWGLTTTTAADQVRLLRTVAYPNAVLGDAQRGYLENLMANVIPEQAWGVSGGVAPDASVALKNGWLSTGDGWAVNSIGHVVGDGHDYLIAVLTSANSSMGYGIETIEGVSERVWSNMLPPDRRTTLSDGSWYLRDATTTGVADRSFSYGGADDIPIVGDWTGQGADTPGVVRGNTWYLRNDARSGIADNSFSFGNPGDVPVVGRWTSTPGDGVGVVRNGVWHLRNTLTSGTADTSFVFGNPGDIPIVGDWDGDGTDGIGVERGGVWYLRNDPSPGPPDVTLTFGNPDDTAIVGDWDGNGADGVGVVRHGSWFLRNVPTSGAAEVTFAYGDLADLPLAGKWNGTTTGPGVAR